MLESGQEELPVIIRASNLSFLMPGLPELLIARGLQHQFGVAAHASVSGPKSGKLLDESLHLEAGKIKTDVKIKTNVAILGQETSGTTIELWQDSGVEKYSGGRRIQVSDTHVTMFINFVNSVHVCIHDCKLGERLSNRIKSALNTDQDPNAEPLENRLIIALSAVATGYIKGLPTVGHSRIDQFLEGGIASILDGYATAIREHGGRSYRDCFFIGAQVTVPGEEPEELLLLHPEFTEFLRQLSCRYALAQGFGPEDAVLVNVMEAAQEAEVALLDSPPTEIRALPQPG